MKILLLLLSINLFSQELRQTIKGIVLDMYSQYPLEGVNVKLGNNTTFTNKKGEYEIKNIPVGNYSVSFYMVGYELQQIQNVVVLSGKQKILNIYLEESFQSLDEVVLISKNRDKENVNELLLLGARSISNEQTNKFAGSFGDPSRMVSNYAGVVTSGDQRNDIIIRGNSPSSILWKLNGLNIPNPNHFGSLGSTGGAVPILNNNNLDKSDFITGGFTADYGNSTSGVFDVKTRKGNSNKTEFTGQIGFTGIELGAEGGFSEDYSGSFLINYRYSVLGFIGNFTKPTGNAIPQFQDINFNISLPTQDFGSLEIFGIGGLSKIIFNENKEGENIQYSVIPNTNLVNESNMGVFGIKHKYFFNNDISITNTIGVSGSQMITKIDTIRSLNDLRKTDYFRDNNQEIKLMFSSILNYKLSKNNIINTGTFIDKYNISFFDKVLQKDDSYISRLDIKNNSILFQYFAGFLHKFNSNFEIYIGLNIPYLGLNNTYSIDPRFSMKYSINPNHKLSFGTGIYSQIQPLFVYFIETSKTPYPKDDINFSQNVNLNNIDSFSNKKLDFTKNIHFVLAYDYNLSENWRLKLETYYQHLYNIPIHKENSFFSMSNFGSSFNPEKPINLENKGTGKNYGIEFTIEKFISDGYYILFSNSIFDSKYKGSDSIERNTAFATNFNSNLLFGYEYKIDNNMLLDFNIRNIFSGGRRTRYIDLNSSKISNETVYDDIKSYSEREKEYFRLDFKVSFKLNSHNISQEWGIDIQNITNQKNIFSKNYNNTNKEISYIYQQGIFPMGFYRIYF